MARRAQDQTKADALVVDALRGQLDREEILLTNVRLTDPRAGDVEIDALILFPDLGAAVLEIKGGLVQFADGEWSTSRGTYRRRIHPTEQARKAKHALRRYIDRQPDWSAPLLRTEWFVALPDTHVAGDMGPEGERSHLLGAGDIGAMRERIRATLSSTINPDSLPAAGWEQDVLALLLRRGADLGRAQRRRTHTYAAAIGTVLAIAGMAWWLVTGTPGDAARGTVPGTGECDPNYEPCLPVTDDLDCSDIRLPVTVSGRDVYGLDRDGDGQACEVYE